MDMSKNTNLNIAKKDKYDEFYTLYDDIDKEVRHYKKHFKGRVVFCNCDDPEWSNFWKYFHQNFEKLGLSGLMATHYTDEGQSYILKYEGDCDSDIDCGVFQQLNGNGDFRSKECIDLLKQYNPIVVTNPPFSLMTHFIHTLIETNVQFLFIGSMNAIKYKNVFPLVKEDKLWLGVNCGSMHFRVPDNYDRNNSYVKDNIKYAKFGNICWYTNLTHAKRLNPIELTTDFDVNKHIYLDNHMAINIAKVAEIPKNYNGIMAVPISFMAKYCPSQFEIIGEFNHGCDNIYDFAKPTINGKELFPRIAIRKVVNA